MSSSTVRISKQAWHILKELAEQRKEPMQNVLEKAVEGYRCRCFLEGLSADFAKLRERPEEWAEEREERRAWDATMGDGLAND